MKKRSTRTSREEGGTDATVRFSGDSINCDIGSPGEGAEKACKVWSDTPSSSREHSL